MATIEADPDRDVAVTRRLTVALESGTLPKQLVISGPAGTGKTYAILSALHCLAADYHGLRILVCRQTRVSLTESVLATFEIEILPSDDMDSIAANRDRDGRPKYVYPGGTEIVLGGLDKATRLLSSAWDIVYVNETIEVESATWDKLWTRLNRPGTDPRFGFLLGDTNPGDPSHWIRARAEAGEIGYWDTGHHANPALHDGRDWTEDGIRYIGPEGLGKLRGVQRKRFYDGLWVAGEGQWFDQFDPDRHVSSSAEFDPSYKVYLSVDTGEHTGAVLWQVRGDGDDATLTVFADRYSVGGTPFDQAKAIIRLASDHSHGRFDVGTHDPAGNARNGYGVVIAAEYARAGLRVRPWLRRKGCIQDRLALLDSFLSTDPPRLLIHPRCRATIAAFSNYRRKKVGPHWLDEPDDPQHPHEEMIDALGSGLLDRFPAGRKPKFSGVARSADAIHY